MEINREKTNKQIWKKAFVPPYFESVWGKTFLDRERDGENDDDNKNQDNAEEQQETQRVNENKMNKKFIGEYLISLIKNLNNLVFTFFFNHSGQTFEDPQFKRRSPLPPISKSNFTKSIENTDSVMKQNYTHYQSKDVEKLDSMKVPNSIKATRGAAVPNTQVFLRSILIYIYNYFINFC